MGDDCDTVFRRGNVGVGRFRVVTMPGPACPVPSWRAFPALVILSGPVQVSGSSRKCVSGSDRVRVSYRGKRRRRERREIVVEIVLCSGASSGFFSSIITVFFPPSFLPDCPAVQRYILYLLKYPRYFLLTLTSHTDTQAESTGPASQRHQSFMTRRPLLRPSRWFVTHALRQMPGSQLQVPFRFGHLTRVEQAVAVHSSGKKGTYHTGYLPRCTSVPCTDGPYQKVRRMDGSQSHRCCTSCKGWHCRCAGREALGPHSRRYLLFPDGRPRPGG
jgi:hypothetical protein